ncbi:ABC1 kinase family protein [Haloarcula litorea]|uniref:ABC1 kinase family protein n=1 Tax=Halobacteriales TaxID=2235 RepID=UPI0023E86F84|nr:AarF/UbiB family protein [Halomicroarcula sp. GDY20]
MIGRVREGVRTTTRFVEILRYTLAEALRYRFSTEPLPEHVHRLVVRLGPTFIKLGQIASTRPDLVPPDVSKRLEDLQENVPAFPHHEARAVIESELDAPPEELFQEFPTDPIASASLSQVYFATLDDGTDVAVKVQRPDIRPRMERDLRIVRTLARLGSVLGVTPRQLPVTRIVDEFASWTLKELDFEVEGHNLEEFRRNFADWDDVTFPAVAWSHTTKRVLTMEKVSGMRLGEVPDAVSEQRRHTLAQRLSELLIKMFVSDGFFHADLHPGNIFFQRNGSIAILDVGMVGRMTTAQRDRFLAYWIAITRRQRDRAFHHLTEMADSTDQADLDAYRDQYDVLLDRFYDKDLSERSLAQTYLEIVYAGAEHGVVFPSEMVLQAKAVVTAESLTLVLAPDYRFSEEIRPIVAEELAKQATPRATMDRAWGELVDWILLGQGVGGEAPSAADPEEAAFRREAIQALADVWTDDIDALLQDIQDDVPEYTSAEYWRDHPEHYVLLETALGLLRTFATELARLEERSDIQSETDAVPLLAVDDADDIEEKLLTGELSQMIDTLQDDTDQYTSAEFWDQNHESRAALISGLTALRLLLSRLNQSVDTAYASESRDKSTPETTMEDIDD